jgi:hypothetical protein
MQTGKHAAVKKYGVLCPVRLGYSPYLILAMLPLLLSGCKESAETARLRVVIKDYEAKYSELEKAKLDSDRFRLENAFLKGVYWYQRYRAGEFGALTNVAAAALAEATAEAQAELGRKD